MKKYLIASLITLALVLTAGCAKQAATDLTDAEREVFESWVKKYYPDATRTPLGAYIIEDTPGTGRLFSSGDDTPYVRMEYTTRALDGEITGYTSAAIAKQLDEYNEAGYYGPKVFYRGNDNSYAGLNESVSEMREGGHRKVIVPGWLMTYKRYNSVEEYIKNVNGSATIYDFTLTEGILDINRWEIDSIGRYMARHFPQKSLSDTTKYGFYYIQTQAPTTDAPFKSDTTFYINYTGRRLDGQVFDSSIRDTAEFYGVNNGGEYSTVLINCGENYTDYSMTSEKASMIQAFAYCLSRMKNGEKGTCIFISSLGYADKGSGDVIPPFSPLRFDIEVVPKTE